MHTILVLVVSMEWEGDWECDWYSWLSKTGLDQSLIYEYGLAFSRNQLQKDDLTYLNHEFLQSMGITVAKHRLEILKLANKVAGGSKGNINIGSSNNNNSLSSKFIGAVNKTKKCLNKFVINKLKVHHQQQQEFENYAIKQLLEPPRRFSRKCKSEKEMILRIEPQPPPPPPRSNYRRIAKSGPLDGRGQDYKLLVSNSTTASATRSLKFSGPLDKRTNDKLMYKSPMVSGPILDQRLTFQPNRSPIVSGPKINNTKEKVKDNTLWAALFQDMKPT